MEIRNYYHHYYCCSVAGTAINNEHHHVTGTGTNNGITDGQPVRADGSNAIPQRIKNDDPQVVPTFGFIVEF